jgi:hypothetical protein
VGIDLTVVVTARRQLVLALDDSLVSLGRSFVSVSASGTGEVAWFVGSCGHLSAPVDVLENGRMNPSRRGNG